MMTAMMLPSALPLLYRFGQGVERRPHWMLATGLLAVTYLALWLGVGLVFYMIYTAPGMPWPNQPIVGAAAIGAGGDLWPDAAQAGGAGALPRALRTP